MSTVLKYLGLAVARWVYLLFHQFLKPYCITVWTWITDHPERSLLLLITGLLLYVVVQLQQRRENLPEP